DGIEKMVAIKDVVVGEHIIIKAGEKMGVDGVIIKGITCIEECMLSGECMPVDKNGDEKVIGGRINENG
ncbi:P-type ATPase, partial [Staphylococcus warneri]